MKQESGRSSDHSNDAVGPDDIKKFQRVNRDIDLNITKMLTEQSERVRGRETTTAASSKDSGGDPYGVLESLVRHNLLTEKGRARLLGSDNRMKITRAYGEARDLMWQAGKAIERSLDPSNATSPPEVLQKQEELKKSFFKALAPFRKIVDYRRKYTFSFIHRDADKLITDLEAALEDIKKSELVSKLPMGVSDRGNELFTIDLSKLEPSNLAKLR